MSETPATDVQTQRAHLGSPRVIQEPTASASVRMIVTLATIRFPNSMYE